MYWVFKIFHLSYKMSLHFDSIFLFKSFHKNLKTNIHSFYLSRNPEKILLKEL